AVVVSGVTVAGDEAKITVEDLPDTHGVAWRVFAAREYVSIVVDMIVQNQAWDGTTDLTFTVPAVDQRRTIDTLRHAVRELVGGHREPRTCAPTASGSRTTTTSARCRWSVSACARTPASPSGCSRSSRRRASTSS